MTQILHKQDDVPLFGVLMDHIAPVFEFYKQEPPAIGSHGSDTFIRADCQALVV